MDPPSPPRSASRDTAMPTTLNFIRRPDSYATNSQQGSGRPRRPSQSMLVNGPYTSPTGQYRPAATAHSSSGGSSSASSSRMVSHTASLAHMSSEDIAASLTCPATHSSPAAAPSTAASYNGRGSGRYAVQGQLAGYPPDYTPPGSRPHDQPAPSRAYYGGGGISQGRSTQTHSSQHPYQYQRSSHPPQAGPMTSNQYACNSPWSPHPGFPSSSTANGNDRGRPSRRREMDRNWDRSESKRRD
ncbi:uncharacterized protein PHACADRAFT_255631 [Phanerochaete carnosa HHB-10118-sp]|uniref:Uncharacterized protein n=1 Tax=Phanerochaete carnosa (strain HHB-10118-sp) TaxID=650164 RepID=K5WXG6_PHACS|nr:uncharacterized protein PHACADRAFT_255631 [Phanerochaete carnosa HHB-10118-sp]EKM55182.1 hypothetical protein PHACADRAFT_255631 [Phanerochaete carnosa HHB-10118-sp]